MTKHLVVGLGVVGLIVATSCGDPVGACWTENCYTTSCGTTTPGVSERRCYQSCTEEKRSECKDGWFGSRVVAFKEGEVCPQH